MCAPKSELTVHCAVYGKGAAAVDSLEQLVHCSALVREARIQGALEGLGDILDDRAEGQALRVLRLACALRLAVLPDLHVGDSDLEVVLVILQCGVGGGRGGGVRRAGGVVWGSESGGAAVELARGFGSERRKGR
jgi:hypothetical protein